MEYVRECRSYQEAKANVGPGEVVVAWAPTPTEQRYGVAPLQVEGKPIGMFLSSYFAAVEREARRSVSA